MVEVNCMPEALQEQTDDATALTLQAENVKAIATADQYHRVVNLRGLLRDMVKKITDARKPAIESAKAHLDLLRKELNEQINPLQDEEKRLGQALVDYDTAQERIKQFREEIEGADSLAVYQKETPSAKETGVSYREIWGAFELVDIRLVPMEYHMIDESAVAKVIRALKEKTNIKGIKVLPPKKIPVQRS